jgi:hypothetical protein
MPDAVDGLQIILCGAQKYQNIPKHLLKVWTNLTIFGRGHAQPEILLKLLIP